MAPSRYPEQIAAILQDLGLDGGHLKWQFYNARWLPAKPGAKTRAEGRFTCTQIDRGVITDALIEVAYKQENEGQVYNTLAHELRHFWQRSKGVYYAKGGLTIWKGTTFAPRPQKWAKVPYGENPAETDARAYARDATLRLFGVDTRVNETHNEVVADLFRKVL